MHARVATFQSDPANLDDGIARIRADVESGNVPPELAGAKVLVLVSRESGTVLGITLFENEEAMREGDKALNAMPGPAGQRSSVEFYEVPVQTVG